MKPTQYGLISGGIVVFAFILSVLVTGEPRDYGLMEVIGYAGMFLSLIVLWFGVRAQARDGAHRFSTLFRQGALMAAVAGGLVGLYTLIHIAVIEPDYGESYTEYMVEQKVASGAAPEEVAATRAEFEEQMDLFGNPFMQMIVMFLTEFILGLITVGIAAAVYRTNTGRGEPVADVRFER